MKIDSSLLPVGNAGLDNTKRTAKTQSSTPSSNTEEVQLSLSGRLQSMENQEGSPVDSARVAAIKDAIAQGRFSINAEAIADRLISSAQELLGKQPQS